MNEKSHLCLKKSSSWQKSGQKNSYRKLISSFLVSTRSKSLLGNFLWWRISARSQGGAGFCCAKTSAPPFDLASILHHKKFPAAFRPCTNQETQKYLLSFTNNVPWTLVYFWWHKKVSVNTCKNFLSVKKNFNFFCS